MIAKKICRLSVGDVRNNNSRSGFQGSDSSGIKGLTDHFLSLGLYFCKIIGKNSISPILSDCHVFNLILQTDYITFVCRQTPKSLNRVGDEKICLAMKEINFEVMQRINGGVKIPNWLECAGAAAGTALFFGGLFVTTGPIGLYAANAILGPTVLGLAWAACAD
jgi:hypothetical protein